VDFLRWPYAPQGSVGIVLPPNSTFLTRYLSSFCMHALAGAVFSPRDGSSTSASHASQTEAADREHALACVAELLTTIKLLSIIKLLSLKGVTSGVAWRLRHGNLRL
jgi:hypothetical protein